MSSQDIALVRELIELQAPLRAAPLADRRRQYDRAERTFGRGVAPGETIDAGGCRAEWVAPRRDRDQPVLVYIHGGGYSLGSTRSHRHLAASIGCAAGAAVLSLDYRRAPEHPFPAAVDDATAATAWLLGRCQAPVALVGDSAGGGLVVAVMIALRDAGRALPAAGACISPWADLTGDADAHVRLAARDPLLSHAELERMAGAYLRDADPRHPLASPALGELRGLPPLLIQAGAEEILLDDARTLARAARAAGVEVTLEEWTGMIHAWPWYFPVLDDGRRAIAAIGAFIRGVASARTRVGVPGRDVARRAPASLTQKAHLLIGPWTAGRGYLSWVYQLNGPLDAHALALAIDEVTARHELLRARFELAGDDVRLLVAPHRQGTLRLVDLRGATKREGLDAAIDDVRALYRALSPREHPMLRATLYTIDARTSVLAMFVAEALVDSDSGTLLAADISRAYATHAGTVLPPGLAWVSETSYLDHIASHPPDPSALARSHAHWAAQLRDAPPAPAWQALAHRGGDPAVTTFRLTLAEWADVVAGAREMRLTPYVVVLTCLQIALARATGVTRRLVHSIVSQRTDASTGMIGNFHGLVRIDTRVDPRLGFRDAAARTAAAVADAIDNSIAPAPLTARGTLSLLAHGEPLPDVRFYMFANHEGPVFAGVRRRRFRLHTAPAAALTVSCIYGHNDGQDFVVSSTCIPPAALGAIADTLATALRMVGRERRAAVSAMGM